MKRILCYGDSNTWGYIPGSDHQRFGKERWPKVLAKLLGDNFEVIEEGLNSRTVALEDPRPDKVGKNGAKYLIPCLDSHDPIDAVVVMLGTNELRADYCRTVEEIGEDFDKYIVKPIMDRVSPITNQAPKVLIVAPPIVDDDGSGIYYGAYDKSLSFNQVYSQVADDNGCYFIGNTGLETGIDSVHLTIDGHYLLANRIFTKLKEMFNIY